MTRAEAKAKIIDALDAAAWASCRQSPGEAFEVTADRVLLALDGALTLDPTIANFSGIAHSVTDVST